MNRISKLSGGQLISLGLVLLLISPVMSDVPVPASSRAASGSGARNSRVARTSKTPRLPIAPQVVGTLVGHSETLLPDGRVLLLGGLSVNAASSSVAIRDPRSSALALVPARLGHARAYHTATLLP